MNLVIPTIGIVGGIGSGKSTVAAALQKHGGYLIVADALGHEALRQPDIKAALVKRWGDSILDAAGEVDRKKVGRIVFADADELRALEALVFPFIEKRIVEETAKARNQPDVKFIILDAAIMLETGWDRHCDKIVFVETPRDLRIARLQKNRAWNEEELDRREAAQMPPEKKMSRAAAVIVNDEGLDKVVRQVQELLLQWQTI